MKLLKGKIEISMHSVEYFDSQLQENEESNTTQGEKF